MFDTKYTYAVARIRALETSLFTSQIIEQLIACDTEEPVSYTHLPMCLRIAIILCVQLEVPLMKMTMYLD